MQKIFGSFSSSFSFLVLLLISGLKAAMERVKRDVKKSVACAIKIF
jgi:hypothetical protein